MPPPESQQTVMPAAPAPEKQEKRCAETRELLSDANIARSPNVGQHWPVMSAREEM